MKITIYLLNYKRFWDSRLACWGSNAYLLTLFVNVCINDFADVKEESNKAASNDKYLKQE